MTAAWIVALCACVAGAGGLISGKEFNVQLGIFLALLAIFLRLEDR